MQILGPHPRSTESEYGDQQCGFQQVLLGILMHASVWEPLTSENILHLGFPGGTSGKEPTCQCRRHKRHRFNPGRSPGGGHGNPLQYSCSENPMDKGDWWATVQRAAKTRTRLKRLSMHARNTVRQGENHHSSERYLLRTIFRGMEKYEYTSELKGEKVIRSLKRGFPW